MGKPRHLKADGGADDARKLQEWREGMAALAALPHLHVKLSMLGYAGNCRFLNTFVRTLLSLFACYTARASTPLLLIEPASVMVRVLRHLTQLLSIYRSW